MKSAYGQRADDVYAAHKTKLFLPGGANSDAGAIQRILAAQRNGTPFRLNPIGSSQPPIGRSSTPFAIGGGEVILLHAGFQPDWVKLVDGFRRGSKLLG